ncbi:MAG: hypothetical protein V1763_02690 [Parcubacteria group bacterium]
MNTGNDDRTSTKEVGGRLLRENAALKSANEKLVAENELLRRTVAIYREKYEQPKNRELPCKKPERRLATDKETLKLEVLSASYRRRSPRNSGD